MVKVALLEVSINVIDHVRSFLQDFLMKYSPYWTLY